MNINHFFKRLNHKPTLKCVKNDFYPIQGSPTYAKITNAVPYIRSFGLCTRKRRIFALVGDLLQSHYREFRVMWFFWSNKIHVMPGLSVLFKSQEYTIKINHRQRIIKETNSCVFQPSLFLVSDGKRMHSESSIFFALLPYHRADWLKSRFRLPFAFHCNAM